MEKQTRAYFYAAVAVLFWATSASAFKICLSPEHLNVPVLPLLFGASLVASFALFINLLLYGKLSLLKTLSKDDLFRSVFLGFLSPFLYYTILFKAYSILPAQQAQPLNFVWPLMLVMLSALILKHKITRRDVLSILISFCGVLVISTKGHVMSFRLSDPLGVALAIGSSIPWSLYWIYNMKDQRDEVLGLFFNFAFASVYVFVLMLVADELYVPGFKAILGITYVGLFEMGITFLIWLKALKHSKSTAHVAGLIYLVPFLSLIVIYFVLGEKILPSTIIGAVLIVGGIFLQKLHTTRSNPEPNKSQG